MLSILSILILLCASAATQPVKSTNWPFNWNDQTLTAPTPLYSSFQVNLQASTSYSLLHTSDVPLQICFQETYAVPLSPSTWNVSCTIQISHAGSAQNQVITLRQSTYNVGIYFDGVVEPGKTTKFTFQLGKADETCNGTDIFNTQNCTAAEPLVAGSNIVNLIAGPQVFSIVVPRDPIITGSIQVKSNASLSFFVRRNAAPSSQYADASGTDMVVVAAPRPGTYYLLVNSSANQSVELFLALEDCTHGQEPHGSGVGCKIVFNHGEDLEAVTATGNEFFYWQVVVQKDEPFRVSVASNDGTPNPRVLLSRGNLPMLQNADFTGCNVEGCGYATIIEVTPVVSSETWYIGVIPVDSVTTQSYGIWLNDKCAPSCEHNGVCTEKGTNIGKCVCNIPEDSGVGCQLTSSLSTQYVVLAAIWGTAIGVTVLVLVAQFVTSSKETYERLA